MAVDLYVLYLRAYTETLRGTPLSPYQHQGVIGSDQVTHRIAPAVEETPEAAIAIALGVEDAVMFRAQAHEVERRSSEEDEDAVTIGFRTRWAVSERVEANNAAEPPSEEDDDE